MAIQIQRTVACDRCGAPARQAFGEGGRGWYEPFRCSSCGQAYEADGLAPAPEEFRQAIIAHEGEWIIEALVPVSLLVLKTLREHLSLSLSEAQQLKQRLPGEICRGTRYEMESLLCVLKQVAEPGSLGVRLATGSSGREKRTMNVPAFGIRTRRYSTVLRRLIDAYAANAIFRIDGKTYTTQDISWLRDHWCTNRSILATRDFEVRTQGVAVAGFHDGPSQLWIASSEKVLIDQLVNEKLATIDAIP